MSTAPRMLIDWPAFLTDPKVKDMPPLTRGVYLLLLGAMWMNEAWLKDDDRIIARKLDMSVRTWRFHRPRIEPVLSHQVEPILGRVLTQKRLTREYLVALDLIEKRKAQTEPARTKRWGKSTKRPSVTERSKPRKTDTVTEQVTDQATQSVSSRNTPLMKDRTLPLQAESSIHPSLPALGASSGGEHVEVDAPSDPALVKRLVSDGLKRRSSRNGHPEPTADERGDRDHQEPLRQPAGAERADAPAVGLFGALEAAIRRGSEEE